MSGQTELDLRSWVILFLVGFGLFYPSGIVFALTTELGSRGWTCTSLPCGASGLVYGSGMLLMIVSGFKILPRVLPNTANVLGKTLESSETDSGPDDKEILWKANELLASVRLRRWRSVQNIEWVGNQQWYWGNFSRKGLRGPTKLVLSSSLRGRLEIVDWNILLTYYFLQQKPGVQRVLGILLRLILPFAPFLLVSILVSFVYGPRGGLLFGASVGPPVLFLLALYLSSATRKVFLKEDARIAGIVGVDKLLTLFWKIDRLGLLSVENGKNRTGWLARLWPMPNIAQRIANLEKKRLA